MPRSTNPFEDSDTEGGNIPTNPFDDEPAYSEDNPTATSDAFGDTSMDESPSGDDVPEESSWKYLGDLPYRRVPIYSSVRWKRHPRDTDDQEDAFNHGLAAFPTSYIKSQHQSQLMSIRDIRDLLANTTVTKVAGCPHGGPIAAMTLPVTASMSSSSMHTTELRIMTNAGRSLSNITLPPRELSLYSASDVLTMGFTERMTLVIVLKDSLCLTYSVDGTPILPPFHIMPSSEGSGTELMQATVYEGGVAVLGTNMQAAIAELLDSHDDPAYVDECHLASRQINPASSSFTAGDILSGGMQNGESTPAHYAIVTPLSTAGYASNRKFTYASIAVLPRFHTTSRHPDVFLSTSDNSVVVVNTVTLDMTDVNCRERISSPILAMAFAPNGRFLACFTQSSILTVISTSFETKVLDFDTSEGSSAPPLDMEWCGEDSVVLHWKNLGVLMVGPYGDWLRFPYEDVENLYIIPEIDCCRVITDSSVELLQRVPPPTALLLRIGSIEPAAMLLDASDAFDSGSTASDEAARAITKSGMLLEAVEVCTEAATREFDIRMQKRLLRAASFGMHFAYKAHNDDLRIMGGRIDGSEADDERVMPSPTAVKFVSAARKLRILNALRNPDVGYVLTASQFDRVTPNGVIARLIAMKRPALATSLSKYLGLPRSVQLFARASKAAALVAADPNPSDSEVAEAAIRIINAEMDDGDGSVNDAKNKSYSMNSGGYATVALAAIRAGRPGVANLLLMLETSVAEKVPALISARSFADASAVATNARDADFIFYTLMECEKTCMATAKDTSVGQSAFLGTVVLKFTAESVNTLRRYYEAMPDVKHVMNLLLRGNQFVDAGAVMAKRGMSSSDVREGQSMLKESSRILGMGKDTGFYKQCTDDFIELIESQEVLRSKYGNPEVAPEGSSVTGLVVAVIHHAARNKREAHRLLADADKLAKKFRIPERRFWHIKVKAFADSEQWANLRNMADSRTKPPIGFKPFARAAIKGEQGNPEILRYIDKVGSPEERYDLFCEARMWKRAVDEAFKLRDGRRIANVRSICNNAEVQDICDNAIERLGSS